MARHPSTGALRDWLEGVTTELDAHIAECSRCATKIEMMQATEPTPSFREMLIESLAVPADLPERLQGGISARIRARNDWLLVSELFALPFDTVRAMATTQGQG